MSKTAIDPKKLQKIVYMAYTSVLGVLNLQEEGIKVRLFPEHIQAWPHGPVVHKLYTKYKEYGYRNIPKVSEIKFNIPKGVIDILDAVWAQYGKYTADELEAMTHEQAPWLEARGDLDPNESCNEIITDEAIFKYYNENIAKEVVRC